MEREKSKRRRHEIISDGPYLDAFEAREGLAKGLLHRYYDGLEEITIDWFDQEGNRDIRLLLAEHFARFSDDCYPYEKKSLELLEIDPSFVDQLLLGAEGKKLYRKIREQNGTYGMDDLFQGQIDDLQSRIISMENIMTSKSLNLKVLFLAAAPKDQTRLRLDEEARDLKEKLQLVQNVVANIEVTHEWAVRVDQIQNSILNGKPAVLHFSGHGGSGVLCFEDRNGDAVLVTSKDFAELIELNKDCIECVVLNACFSDDIAKEVAPHVKCVVGCDDSIADDAAIMFTRSFYRALANGKSFEESFRFAKNEVSLAGMRKEADKYKITLR